MFYEKLCGVLLAQLSFHDAMLKSAKEKAKVRQEMSTVVLGVMVVGIVAYAGSVWGAPLSFHDPISSGAFIILACPAAMRC
ncbi:MAG: hypothetical protein OXU25_05670 [Thaumarchaeota archaeon]|nr:hypothetical protein [Nitrososphaerota archaeon]